MLLKLKCFAQNINNLAFSLTRKNLLQSTVHCSTNIIDGFIVTLHQPFEYKIYGRHNSRRVTNGAKKPTVAGEKESSAKRSQIKEYIALREH